MTVKKVLEEFAKAKTASPDPLSEHKKLAQKEIEQRLIQINRCFVDIILPSLFEVENDLNQAGYWNQMTIGQSTSLASGKPNIKEVSLNFYPEPPERFSLSPQKIDTAYKARIWASGNLREINLSLQFPKRIPPGVELDDTTLSLEEIDTARLDAFLEKFVKGALAAYNSDRMLR